MRLDGAILDIDGTILDSMPVWHDCGARVLARLGIEAEPGLGYILFAFTVSESARYLIENYGLDMTEDDIRALLNEEMKRFYQTEADFKPGALHFLKELRRRNIPAVVVTSTDQEFIESAFQRLGISDWFAGILSSGTLGTSKGEPEIWKQAAALLPGPALYVFDDGLYAIRAAKDTGLGTIGIYDAISAGDEEEMRRISDMYLYSIGDYPFDELPQQGI